MNAIACAIVLCILSAGASADIIEWQDASGVRHYTNMKDDVPKEHRESAQVVVDELVSHPLSGEAPAASSKPAVEPSAGERPSPHRRVEVLDERLRLAEAYLAGLRRGLGVGTGGAGAEGGDVRIDGPLAVASAPSQPASGVSYPYLPFYYPPVSTSFDRGRSRYLTLRMFLQNQFALDREGPFVFEDRLISPVGRRLLDVNANPFLSRGWSRGFPTNTLLIAR